MEPATRLCILDAADQLFGEVGLDAATTRDIAERCGVNKALIHYHFATKDKLLVAVLDRYYVELSEVLQSSLARGAAPRDRLVATLDAYVDFLSAHPRFFRIVQREIAGGRHVDDVTSRMLPLFEAGAALITEAWPATKKGPLSAEALMVSFYGMVITYFSYSPVIARLTAGDPLSAAQLRQHKRHLARMIDLVLAELEPASARRKSARHGKKGSSS